jgi:hypothetical protein
MYLFVVLLKESFVPSLHLTKRIDRLILCSLFIVGEEYTLV